MENPFLRVIGVSKRFDGVRALEGVSLDFFKGEIHAVLGENGAGKSTLMGVLSGFVVPDSGSVVLDGSELPLGRPYEAMSAGVRMVHQHFMLVGAFSVCENLALSRLGRLRGGLDLGRTRDEALALSDRLGWKIELDAKVGDLPVGARQRIEILKALAGDARVLILDEPTAVLSQQETSEIFDVLRRLRDEGVCIVLIAHKLREVMQIADRATVLRGGAVVATSWKGAFDESTLARQMVGDSPAGPPPRPSRTGGELYELFDVTAVGETASSTLKEVSLQLNRGEIVGIGGVEGNGQNELAEVCAGLRNIESGQIRWHDKEGKIGYVPPDRHADGLALQMSVEDNFLIESQHEKALWAGPFFKKAAGRAKTDALIKEYGIKVGKTTDPVGSLSGGNQQKVVVSRVIAANPNMIVASNPTRGLDLKAAAHVRASLVLAADNGAAVLLFSTDRDELQELAARTLWMGGGRLYKSETDALKGGPR